MMSSGQAVVGQDPVAVLPLRQADKECIFSFGGGTSTRVFSILASALANYPESTLAVAARLRDSSASTAGSDAGAGIDEGPIRMPKRDTKFVPFIFQLYRAASLHNKKMASFLLSSDKLPMKATADNGGGDYDFRAEDLAEELDYYQLPFKLKELVLIVKGNGDQEWNDALEGWEGMEECGFEAQLESARLLTFLREDLLAAPTIKEMRRSLCFPRHAAFGEAFFIFTLHEYGRYDPNWRWVGPYVLKPWIYEGFLGDLLDATPVPSPPVVCLGGTTVVELQILQIDVETEELCVIRKSSFSSDLSLIKLGDRIEAMRALGPLDLSESDGALVGPPNASCPFSPAVRPVAEALKALKGLTSTWYHVDVDYESALLLHVSWGRTSPPWKLGR